MGFDKVLVLAFAVMLCFCLRLCQSALLLPELCQNALLLPWALTKCVLLPCALLWDFVKAPCFCLGL